MANFMRKIKKKQIKAIKNKTNSESGFDPKLPLQEYLTFFSMRVQTLSSMADDILSATAEEFKERKNTDLKSIRYYLGEDNMLYAETWNTVKEFTSLINSIGGVLLPEKVEEMFKKSELEEYYKKSFQIYGHLNIYYKLFLRERIVMPLIRSNALPSHRNEVLSFLFPDYTEVYKDFEDLALNIDKDVFPEFIEGMTTNEANEFFINCINNKCNSKLIFKFGQNIDKQIELENEFIYDQAKKILELKF
jgi:hypothetical protein